MSELENQRATELRNVAEEAGHDTGYDEARAGGL